MTEDRSTEQEGVRKLNRDEYWAGKLAEDRKLLPDEEFNKKWGAKYADLERLRFVDPATNILTRKGFEHALGDQIAQARENNSPITILMLDLDGLKRINDDISHAEGNRAIKEMSKFLKEETNETGIIGRYGGDEFALIYPDKSLEEGKILAETIRFKLRHHMKRKGLPVTSSVGLTTLRPDNQKVPRLLNEADAALNVAKRTGRDQVVVFSPEMLEAA